MPHKIQYVYGKTYEFDWAVIWPHETKGDVVICLCPEEEWAKEIAHALDLEQELATTKKFSVDMLD